MAELEELPASRQGPFGYEFPGDQPPPQASGPPLLNPSEDRVLDNFIQGVGSDRGWLDDQLLISVDESRSTHLNQDTRPPMPPPVQHIMTSLPAQNTHRSIAADQIFQEPLCLSDVDLRNATKCIVPTSFPYVNDLPSHIMPRDPRIAFLDMNNFYHQANTSGSDQFYGHPAFGTLNYTMRIEHLQQPPRFGAEGQDAWPRHGFSDRPGEPMLGLANPNLNQRYTMENPIQFGSDLRFARDRFEAPDHQQTEARLRAIMIGQVHGLVGKGNVGESRPSSPELDGPQPHSPVHRMETVDSSMLAPENEDCDSPIKDCSASSSAKPRGPATKRGNSVASRAIVKPASRSRKNKGKRHTNLSNEQRVDNHRQSEQRRRDEIRNSYLAMKATIPGMGDKKTKGAEMQYTVTWMRQTLKENEKLLELLENVTKGK